jgi:hypothetical protein
MINLRSALRRLAAGTPLGRRTGLDQAWRKEAFRRYIEARQLASDSSDIREHAVVGRAYRSFLCTYLRPVEGRLVEMENEIVRLRDAVEAIRESIPERHPYRKTLRVVSNRSGDPE